MNMCSSCAHLEVRGVVVCESPSSECKSPLGTYPNTLCEFSQSSMNNITVKTCGRYKNK